MGETKLQELKRAAEAEPENIDKWLELGKYAADRFIVGVSEEALIKVLKERPNDIEALSLFAKALNRRRKLNESENIYKKAIEIDPENPELLTGLGVVYGNRGELKKAVEWYKKSLAIDPGYPWTVHAYKHSLENIGQHQEIEPMLTAGLEANPKSALIQLSYAAFLKEKGHSEYQKYADNGIALLVNAEPEEQSRAIRILKDIRPDMLQKQGKMLLENDPDNVDILLSLCMFARGSDTHSALKELKKALEGDPQNVRLMTGLLGLLMAAGDIAGLMEMKARIDAAKPEDALMDLVDMTLGQRDIGGLLTSEEKRKQMVESSYKVLQRMPGNLNINGRYIQALIDVGRREDAAKHIDYVMKNHLNKDSKDLLSLGFVLRENLFFQEAETVIKRATECASSPLEGLLVKITENLGPERYQTIADLIQSYIENNDSPPELYAILGRVQSYVGNPSAKQSLEYAVRGRQFDSMILLANLLRKDNDMIQSKILLEKVIESQDARPIDKARSLFGLGNHEEGLKALEEIVKENPLDLIAWQLLIMAQRRNGPNAVNDAVKRMIESGRFLGISNEPQATIESMKLDDLIKEYTDHVLSGIVAGQVKQQLLIRLVANMMNEDIEEGI